jgi:hypothetical protein
MSPGKTLAPGIHDLGESGTKDVDGRDKPGHDDLDSAACQLVLL